MFCPNYKIKEVFDGFNEIVELYGGRPMTEDEFQSSELRNQRTGLDLFAMEAAYRLYDKNNGNFLDKAPNGKDSILYNTLLQHFGGNRQQALKAKANVYSRQFLEWFGDWTSNTNDFNLDNIDYSLVDVEEYTKPWKDDPKKSNRAIKIYLKDQHEKGFFELVKDHEDGYFSVHFKTTKEGAKYNSPTAEPSSKEDRKILFQQLVNAIPNGAKISTWGSLSEDGVRGLDNVGRNMHNIGERSVRLKSDDSEIKIPIYQKGYDVSKVVDENGEPLVVWHGSHKKFDSFDGSIFFFSSNREYAFRYGSDLVYNAKKVKERLDILNRRQAILEKRIENQPYFKYAEEHAFEPVPQYLQKQYDDWEKTEYERIKRLDKIISTERRILMGYQDEAVYNGLGREHYFDRVEDQMYPVYLNIKEDITVQVAKASADIYNEEERRSEEDPDYGINMYMDYSEHFDPNTYTGMPTEENYLYLHKDIYFNIPADLIKNTSGLIGKDINTNHTGYEYAVFNPNQIMHVENLGTWSPTEDNMYSTPSENLKQNLGAKDHGYTIKLNTASSETAFGSTISEMLKSGKVVSSNQVLQYISQNQLLSDDKIQLAKLLANHNIPIVYGTLKHGKLAAAITDSTGGTVVVINPDYVNTVSVQYLSDTILHEVIHAVTVNALDHPTTANERNFARVSKATYQLFDKIIPLKDRYDVTSGGYVMENEKEFASVFMTDENARDYLYQKAREFDKQNAVLKFIKALVNLFVNREIFTGSAVEQLDEYKRQMTIYLANRPTVDYSDINSKQLIKLVFDRMYHNSFAGDRFQDAIENAVLIDKSLQINYRSANGGEQLIANFPSLSRILMTRLHMIKRSNLGKAEISRQSQLIESQASMLMNEDYAIKLQALRALANQLGPQVREDFDYLSTLPELDAEQYMTTQHTNIGTYKKLAKIADEILSNGQEVSKMIRASYEEFKNGKEDSEEQYENFKQKILEDIINLQDVFTNIQALSDKCITILNRIRKRSVKTLLLEIGSAVKDPSIEEYLNHIELIDFDTNFAVQYMGSADSAEDTALRALSYLVNQANTKTQMEMIKVASRLAKKLSKIKKSQLELLYEKDSKGRTTGYLIRKRNYGQFYDDYNDFIVSLNRAISKKYGIKLDDNNRIAPVQKGARYEWNHERNKWLSERCNRRYVNRYYEAQEKLSAEAVLRMFTINSQIYQINMLPGVMQENGHPDYSVLTDEQWDELQNLITKKKFLRREVDEWGHLKCDAELEIAREIDEYYKQLYPDGSTQMEQDWQSWEEARNAVFEECGGQVEYDKMSRGEEHSFNKKKWDKWNTRNSKLEFIKDIDGKPLVFKQILFDLNEAKPYYGEEEEKIAKEVNELISTFYGTNMIVNDKSITKAMQNKISGLISKQIKLREAAKKNNPALEKLSAKYGAIFNSYIEFVTTDRFRKLEADVMEKAWEDGDFDEFLYYSLMQQYGTVKEKWDTAEVLGFIPFRWFTKMQARDIDSWMVWSPGDAYNDVENSSSLRNSEFDESEGVSFIPFTEGKFKKYDNSKNYARVHKTEGMEDLFDKNLSEMYDEVVKIMEESNSKLVNRVHSDKFLLPQISGTLYKRLTSNKYEGNKIHRWWKVFLEWLGEGVGIRKRTTQDDTIFGENNKSQDYDETGTPVESKYVNLKDIGLLKNMPDEKPMHIIPQYFTTRKSPEYISKDLLGIVFSYAQMASNYKNKLAIKDKCEMIVDQLQARHYNKQEIFSSQVSEIGGDKTRTYAMAQKFLEMNLYDIRRNRNAVNTPDPNITWQYTHALDLLKNYTTANNLGLNPKVSIVGMLTSQYNHFINALCGNGYSFGDAHRGGQETICRIVKNTITNGSYVGQIGSDDKLMVIDRFYNVQNQLEKEITNSHVSRLQKAVRENYVFGMMSGLDFISKTSIALSILYSYRFVDGEFLTKDLIYLNASKLPKEQRDAYIKDKLDKYKSKKIRKDYNLYHLISVKDGEFYIENEEARKAYTDDLHHMIKSRIEKLAERADGMATTTQKAAITQSQIGALILVHRQYLPLMIQERFSKEVYDYDMAMMKNGQLNMLFRLCTQIAQTSVLAGGGVGALSTFLLMRSIPGFPIYLAAGTLLGMWYANYSRKKGKGNKTTKQVWNEFFNDDSTPDSFVRSMYHKRIRKQIAVELIAYQVLSMFIGFLCTKADDDKDDWWLQFAALCSRQFQWEAYTPYRFDDVFNNFKTVTAATGTLDYIQNSLGGFGALLTQALNYFLYNTLGDADENSSILKGKMNTKVKSGVYKGWDKPMKSLYKTTPMHNMYQQGFYAPIWEDPTELPTIKAGGAIGPYKMRTYTENQIMKINE